MRKMGIEHLLRKFSKLTTCDYCVVHMIECVGIVDLHKSQFVAFVEIRTQVLEDIVKLCCKPFTL